MSVASLDLAPPPTSLRLTEAEERAARGIVAAHRARLDWLLRVPQWSGLFAAGLTALALPGQRQGIAFDAALLALPLESKHELVRWVLEHFRDHLRSATGQRICRLFGLELFDGLELEDVLTVRQWQRMRRELLFRLAHEHRRYKHAQQLLFTGCRHLIAPVVAQIVFRPEHRADCAQEGALGLLAAIDRVDASEHQLAAYATSWIRRHVRNHLMRQRLPVSAPLNLISQASQWRAAEETAGVRRGAGDDEQAQRLQALLLECLRHPAVALDEPLDATGRTAADSVADAEAESPAEAAARRDVHELVGRALAVLTEKQRSVLVQRFGLRGRVACTLSEIARRARISHQQAGQRERRALQRLEAALAPLAAEWRSAGGTTT